METQIPSTPAPTPTAITIVVQHGRATVHADTNIIASVLPEVECRVRRFEPGEKGSVEWRDEIVDYYVHDHRGRLVVRPGLVPLLKNALESRGFEIAVDDRRILPSDLAPDADALARASGNTLAVMQAAASNLRGQIQAGGIEAKANAIAALYKLFPTLDTLVMTSSRKRAYRLARELRRHVGDYVQVACGGWRANRALVVAPYPYADAHAWHVMILADPCELVNGSVMEKVDRLLDSPLRVYSLTPPNGFAARHARLSVLHASGPVIHRVGAVPKVLTVLPIPVSASVALRGLEGLAYKRAAYWHNTRRNQVIADVAKAVAAQGLHGLWQLGFLPDEPLASSEPPRIVVLVESTEHAAQVMPFLPGWKFFSKTIRAKAAMSPSSDNVSGAIVTASYAADYGIEADVFICANGINGSIVVQDLVGVADRAGGGLFIVDFDDGFDPRAAAEAKRRLVTYQKLGWTILQQRRGHLHASPVVVTHHVNPVGNNTTLVERIPPTTPLSHMVTNQIDDETAAAADGTHYSNHNDDNHPSVAADQDVAQLHFHESGDDQEGHLHQHRDHIDTGRLQAQTRKENRTDKYTLAGKHTGINARST